jgi:hypothetical protein
MRFTRLVALLVLLGFTTSTTEVVMMASAWLKPGLAEKASVCALHSFNCRCPEACEVQQPNKKPKVKVSCHAAPESESKAQPEPSSLGSCVLKAACGHGEDANHVTHRPEVAVLQLSQVLPFTTNRSPLNSQIAVTSVLSSHGLAVLVVQPVGRDLKTHRQSSHISGVHHGPHVIPAAQHKT